MAQEPAKFGLHGLRFLAGFLVQEGLEWVIGKVRDQFHQRARVAIIGENARKVGLVAHEEILFSMMQPVHLSPDVTAQGGDD